jgi:hypothetical protein
VLLTVLEVVFLAAFLVGVAFLVGWPAALAVGGALGVVVCEVAERRRRPEQPQETPR